MMKTLSKYLSGGLLALGAVAPAYAHTGLGLDGFSAGFTHPLMGLDHTLVMLAVGAWAANQGVRYAAAALLGFPACMVLGGALAMAGWSLPWTEPLIAASVLMMGLVLLWGYRVAPMAISLMIPLFAIAHGHAHGAELPMAVSPVLYGIGFVVATALLHGIGFWTGRTLIQHDQIAWLRLSGMATGFVGVSLLAGW